MVFVAVLLLPLLSILLLVMDRIEDRVLDPAPPRRRHVRHRRHLRLIAGGRRSTGIEKVPVVAETGEGTAEEPRRAA
ncbi:hypothetical protein [Streptomyces sp. NPDC046197]|uniref:hypothetical protein n=1 Tax=Streptomyces sp. NPDC046197 TaxID=3154337 RepID=UPI0033DF8D5C